MTKYIYHGDRFTSPELKGKTCTAVRRKDGKCYRSRLGTMLVEFEGVKHIVLARRLRKIIEVHCHPIQDPEVRKVAGKIIKKAYETK